MPPIPVELPTRAPAPQAEDRRRRLGSALVAAVAVYVAAAAGMALVFASGPPPRLVGHLAELEEGFGLYRWGFVGASLLAPALIAVLLLLVTVAGVPLDSVSLWVGTVLLAGYLPFVTVVTPRWHGGRRSGRRPCGSR